MGDVELVVTAIMSLRSAVLAAASAQVRAVREGTDTSDILDDLYGTDEDAQIVEAELAERSKESVG